MSKKKFGILSEYLNQHWRREEDHQGILVAAVSQTIHLYNDYVAPFVSTTDLTGRCSRLVIITPKYSV